MGKQNRSDRLTRKERVDVLLSISGQHLERVKQLSDREWKTDVLYWTLTLISGSGLITYCAKSDSSLAPIVANHDWVIISGYTVAASIYFMAMSGNKHRSLVTERIRYQLTQDIALKVARVRGLRLTEDRSDLIPEVAAKWHTPAKQIRTSFDPIKRRRILTSSVWGAKVLASWAMVSAIWFLSQVASHYTSELQYKGLNQPAAQVTNSSASPARPASAGQGKSAAEQINFACAFLVCEHKAAPPVTAWPRNAELGFYVWLFFTVFYLILGGVALWRGSI